MLSNAVCKAERISVTLKGKAHISVSISLKFELEETQEPASLVTEMPSVSDKLLQLSNLPHLIEM